MAKRLLAAQRSLDLKLTVRDVLLNLDPPRLEIHKAKFHKSDQQGIDIRAHSPELSVYFCHLGPAHNLVDLSATPELLSEAARSFAAYSIAGG